MTDGGLAPLLDWPCAHVYRHGRKLTAPQLLERATDEELSAATWLRCPESKFRM